MGTSHQDLHPPTNPQDCGPECAPLSWQRYCWNHARRMVIFVIGMTVLLLGVAMLALPGPGTLVIPVGLAILASEFAWAAWLLRHAKERIRQFDPRKRGRGDSRP